MKRILLLLFACIGLTLSASWVAAASTKAATPTQPAPDLDSQDIESAAVTLDGRTLFHLRGMAGYSAADRAKEVEKRIESAAANQSISTSTIVLKPLADRTELMAGDLKLANLLDADAAMEKLPRAIWAEGIRLNVADAILDYRHDRSTDVLLRRTALAAVATLALLVMFMASLRFHKRLTIAAERYLKARFLTLEARSSNVIESGPLWAMVVGVLNLVRFIVLFGLFYFYFNLVLGLYPWTRPLASQLFFLFISPLYTLGKKFLLSVPNLAFLAILFIIVKYVLKVTRLFFSGIEHGTFEFKDFDRDWASPTFRIVRIFIICFAVVVAYPYIPGSNTDAFKGVSVFIGIIFSLGSTSFIGNMIAGIALTYRRAFKVGDFIKVNDIIGVVTDMRLQTTNIRTRHNEVVVIPNSIPLNSHVINYTTLSRDRGVLLNTHVGVGYQAPWRQVEAMLLMAAERTPGLLKDHKPFVLQRSLGDFSVDYELNVYCDAPQTMPVVYNDLHKNVLDIFNEYGVQIMTPAYEGDPENPKVVSKDHWHAAPAKKSDT